MAARAVAQLLRVIVERVPVLEYDVAPLYPGMIVPDPVPIQLGEHQWLAIFADSGRVPSRFGLLAERKTIDERPSLHIAYRVQRGPRWLGRRVVVARPTSLEDTEQAVRDAAAQLLPLVERLLESVGSAQFIEHARGLQLASLTDWVAANTAFFPEHALYLSHEISVVRRARHMKALIEHYLDYLRTAGIDAP